MPFKTDLNNPFVIFAVIAINEMYWKAGDNGLRSPVKLLSADKQFVGGDLYTFELEITGGPQEEVCTAQVLSQVWLTGDDKTKIPGSPKCQPKDTFLQDHTLAAKE